MRTELGVAPSILLWPQNKRKTAFKQDPLCSGSPRAEDVQAFLPECTAVLVL